MKKLATIIALAAALGGCAVPTTQVNLPQASAPLAGRVTVTDTRLDRQLYLQEVTYTGTAHLMPIASEPPFTEVLAHLTERETSASGIRVEVERVELVNRVGFGQRDELTCGIESSASIGGKPPQRVRTLARNGDNLSPRRSTAGAVILADCLGQHAKDIAQALKR